MQALGRSLFVAVAVTCFAAQPAAAAATATVKGVVVARDQARGTLVVATGHGAVATLRTTTVRRVGTRVVAKVTRLADGTYRARSAARRGTARRATVHAVVVSAANGSLVLSAGGSVFSVRRGRVVSAVATSGPRPGSVVDASLTIDPASGSVGEDAVHQVGQASLVSLEGTISSLAADSLVLEAEDGAQTTVAIPPSIVLPAAIAAGDRVELLVQFAAGTFTLVSIQDDHAAAGSGSGTVALAPSASGSSGSAEDGSAGEARMEAEGIVTAVSSTSLSVQGEHASTVTFVVPAGVDVSGVTVGARVHAKGVLAADGTVTLAKVEVQSPHAGNDANADVEAEGPATAVDAGSLTVQPSDGGAPVVFTVPAGFDVSSVVVGVGVSAKGVANADGSITLAKLEVHGSSDQSGSGSQGASGSQGGSGDRGGSGEHGGSGDQGSGGDG